MGLDQPRARVSSEVGRASRALRAALRPVVREGGPVRSYLQDVRRGAKRVQFHVRSRLRDAVSHDPYLHTERIYCVLTSTLRHRTGLPYGYDPALNAGAVVP